MMRDSRRPVQIVSVHRTIQQPRRVSQPSDTRHSGQLQT
jgi:hypothetical protein